MMSVKNADKEMSQLCPAEEQLRALGPAPPIVAACLYSEGPRGRTPPAHSKEVRMLPTPTVVARGMTALLFGVFALTAAPPGAVALSSETTTAVSTSAIITIITIPSFCTFRADGTPCSDGLFCDGADFCFGGRCVAHAGNPCTGGGECADVCDEDHDKCARPAGSACSSDGNGCTDDVCDGDGQCTHPDNTAPCNDGKFCTVNDHCGGGECHGTPRDCTASADACRTGVCDEEAGQCTGPAKPNNTPCDDGDKCTLTDVCLNARCIGGAPVTCPAPDECHDAATCDPLDGTCSGPRKAPGTPCAGGALTCNAAGECARPASCGNGVFEPENGELCDGEDCCTADCTFKGATEVCGVETRVC